MRAAMYVPDVGDTGDRQGRFSWMVLWIGEPGDLFPPPREGPVDRFHEEDVHFW
jgi:hypothetical protein